MGAGASEECSVKRAEDCVNRAHPDSPLTQTFGNPDAHSGYEAAHGRNGHRPEAVGVPAVTFPLTSSGQSSSSRGDAGSDHHPARLAIDGITARKHHAGNAGSASVPALVRALPERGEADAAVDDGAGVGLFDQAGVNRRRDHSALLWDLPPGPSTAASSFAPSSSAPVESENVGMTSRNPVVATSSSLPAPTFVAGLSAPLGAFGSSTTAVGLQGAFGASSKTYFDCELGQGPLQADDETAVRTMKYYAFHSGATYNGEWLHGNRDGVGQQRWEDGTEYVGQWLRGRAHGRGQIMHADGDSYIGEWVNGRAHGHGTYYFQGRDGIYTGIFSCDLREGDGIEEWSDGSYYRGQFSKSEKSGYGMNVWPDGTQYVGGWKNNELLGVGTFSVDNGPCYRGQWVNSRPHGAGLYKWPGGRTYAGQYAGDRKHGFGVLTEPDGSRTETLWERGEPKCSGLITMR